MSDEKKYPDSVFLGQLKPFMKDGKPVVWSSLCGMFKYKMTYPQNFDRTNPVFNLYCEQMPPKEKTENRGTTPQTPDPMFG